MPKLNLLEILKNTIVEQTPPGMYGYDVDPEYQTMDVDTGVASFLNVSKIDINSKLLILPSTRRGSLYDEPRGVDGNGKPIIHKGIDYPISVGTLIYVINPGVVKVSGMNVNPTGWGALVEISHDDGTVTRYGHLSKINVSEGDKVDSGTLIGETGGEPNAPGSGNSQGPHLHFETLVGGKNVDPADGHDDKSFRFLKKSDKDKVVIKPLDSGKKMNDALSNYKNERVIYIDYSKPSSEKRLWVKDGDKVLLNTYVSHGKNSGDLYATKFSNEIGSNMSSLGVYQTAETYNGKHGISLRVKGLESTNSNAYTRDIVFHSADYVSDSHLSKYGQMGRSHGCFATSAQDNKKIIELVKEKKSVKVIVVA